jgi:hypothetical protein
MPPAEIQFGVPMLDAHDGPFQTRVFAVVTGGLDGLGQRTPGTDHNNSSTSARRATTGRTLSVLTIMTMLYCSIRAAHTIETVPQTNTLERTLKLQ